MGGGGKTGSSGIIPSYPMTSSVIGLDGAAAVPLRATITLTMSPAAAQALHACADHLNISASAIIRTALVRHLTSSDQFDELPAQVQAIVDWDARTISKVSRHMQRVRQQQALLQQEA